ncbi:NUDIX domain-containing protein [Actinomadura fibrosa]|uniref:NUDIX domain-containing protein n=1 Tax=Actinomadura fibrosa TaxID=111802 RepID=A0ABW2XAX8_9ACTN|nr:NUDIX hydrolase [Actinomadura fibrosa]
MPDQDARERSHLLHLLNDLEPWDATEEQHRRQATEWITSGAPLYRTRKPDVPPIHLVSYAILIEHGRILMVDHRLAGLRLPPGGHVEPSEEPWRTVTRETHEELGVEVVPNSAECPFFVTWTQTRGAGRHTDVSLWYLAHPSTSVTTFDDREFAGIEWMSPSEILTTPITSLDPNMHRFTHKLQAVL